MTHIEVPHDSESALDVLSKFMDNALNTGLKKHFLKAVYILYGWSYIIKEDVGHRMCFYCTVCHKEMNSFRSLTDHSNSGSHIKNEDSKKQEKYTSKSVSTRNYHPNSLEFRIYNSMTPILGCQALEAYDAGIGVVYYKCNLCGAHDKVDAMYKHVIGDKHTDKYIRARIILKNPITITSEERAHLRKEISIMEPFNVQNIRTIKGKNYYPYKWKDEGRSYKYKFEKFDSKRIPASINSHSEVKRTVKPDVENLNKNDEYLKFRNPSPPPVLRPKTENLYVSKMIQCYSYGFLDNILLKFNIIVQTHLSKVNDVHSCQDLKVALNILNYALHLLYHVNREQLIEGRNQLEKLKGRNQLEKLKEQKNVMETCLGYVFKRMAPYFDENYGDWSFASRT